MFRTKLLITGCFGVSLVFAAQSIAQTAAPTTTTRHVIVVNLVEHLGSKVPFAFEPATFNAERGDTLRFVQVANTMHNVHFKTQPKGAKLGSAATSPYLTTKGQSYNVVVDSRFSDGTYELVCDPHEIIGMHAFLTVQGVTTGATSK